MNHTKFLGCLALAASLGGLVPAGAQVSDPPLSMYNATVLTRNLASPTSFAFLPDGRIYITRKNGSIRLLDPTTGDTATAAALNVGNAREDGLHSLVLDPDFATNRWVYLLFSNASRDSVVVARYTTDPASAALITESRQTLLQVPYTINTNNAEHNTGHLAFGPDGNLFVALADNTQNIFSGTGAGYAPRDPARPLYDAQRTSGNTNDLRGKILRIRPEANGTYSIPQGNLIDSIATASFNPNWSPVEDELSRVRPEIFVMGLRHPFRISVDKQTGWLFWAEPGPNAQNDNASQGPRGYETIHMASGPGNYGWPYCRGNPEAIQKPESITTPFCYTEYNYSGSGTAGPMYNPAALRNTSVNNTGIVNLPPVKPAHAWYPYNAAGTAFPIFGTCNSNCNTAVIGPVYNYNHSLSAARLHSAFHRHVFIIEWVRNHVLVARVGEDGNLHDLRTFRNARDSVTNGPMDMQIGPDGALYILNWVNSGTSGYNYPNNQGAGNLVRFEYTGPHEPLSLQARTGQGGGELRRTFFAGVHDRVIAWPDGAVRAEIYSLRGERVASLRRTDRGERTMTLPASARGVVQVRFLGR